MMQFSDVTLSDDGLSTVTEGEESEKTYIWKDMILPTVGKLAAKMPHCGNSLA